MLSGTISSTALVSAVLASVMAMLPAAHAATGSQRLEYRVQHSKYGEVGTYTNTVERNGDSTTVSSKGRIKVSLLGIPVYSQQFERTERWNGAKLMSFRGVTTENGKKNELSGSAEGENFVLRTPTGTEMAPSTVRPANPWSDTVLGGDMIFTPDEGKLEKVRVTAGKDEPLVINGQTVQARHYRIERSEGDKYYEVWLDGEGVPVKFADAGPKETVTFSLASCEGAAVCRVLEPQLARK